jgi:hypothetical protein
MNIKLVFMCCAVLCCAVLCCAVLCAGVLRAVLLQQLSGVTSGRRRRSCWMNCCHEQQAAHERHG